MGHRQQCPRHQQVGRRRHGAGRTGGSPPSPMSTGGMVVLDGDVIVGAAAGAGCPSRRRALRAHAVSTPFRKYQVIRYAEPNNDDSVERDVGEPETDVADHICAERYVFGTRCITPTATTLRTRSGAMTITDGPFAEAAEQIGGFPCPTRPRRRLNLSPSTLRRYTAHLTATLRALLPFPRSVARPAP